MRGGHDGALRPGHCFTTPPTDFPPGGPCVRRHRESHSACPHHISVHKHACCRAAHVRGSKRLGPPLLPLAPNPPSPTVPCPAAWRARVPPGAAASAAARAARRPARRRWEGGGGGGAVGMRGAPLYTSVPRLAGRQRPSRCHQEACQAPAASQGSERSRPGCTARGGPRSRSTSPASSPLHTPVPRARMLQSGAPRGHPRGVGWMPSPFILLAPAPP